MSKLEELINELCPDGVEYITIGSVVNYEQPLKYIVQSTNYSDENNIPVLTAGQTFVLGYTNEIDNIYNASKERPVIIFDDFTGAFKWVDFPFKLKSSAIKILTTNNSKTILRYIYHIMSNIGYCSNEHKRLWISTYSLISIPLPPLPVQQEIVRILDKFTELTAELTAELEARKKQYEYYKKKLLTFEGNPEIKWMMLGDIGKISMCKRILKEQTQPIGDIPFFKIGTLGKKPDAFISKNLYDEYKRKYPYPKKGDVLISASGTIGRAIIFDGTPSYFQDSNIVWIDNDEKIVSNKYLYHFYSVAKWAVAEGGTITRLYNDNIRKTLIPVPPLEEQERIVSILDRFDALCNDLTIGLPAEIEARQKQYEYYRDKLLSFKPLPSKDKEVAE